MDFEKVLRELLGIFSQEGVAYAAMGGFALGAHGAARATTDIDFIHAFRKISLGMLAPAAAPREPARHYWRALL